MPPVISRKPAAPPRDPVPPGTKCVIDVRGTHGSGKTSVMRALLGMGTWEDVRGEARSSKDGPLRDCHLGHLSRAWDAVLVGKYAADKAMGGCDGVYSPHEVCRRVRLFSAAHRLVFLEGILVSHIFGTYSKLASELEAGGLADDPVQYRFYFLDTPLETCLSRVQSRRAASARTAGRPFDDTNVRRKHADIWTSVRRKCRDAGHRVYELDHRDPVRQILGDLGLGGVDAAGTA